MPQPSLPRVSTVLYTPKAKLSCAPPQVPPHSHNQASATGSALQQTARILLVLVALGAGVYVNPLTFALRVHKPLRAIPSLNLVALTLLSVLLLGLSFMALFFWMRLQQSIRALANPLFSRLWKQENRHCLLGLGALFFIGVWGYWAEMKILAQPCGIVWVLELCQQAMTQALALLLSMALVRRYLPAWLLVVFIPLLALLPIQWLVVTNGAGNFNLSMLAWVSPGAALNLLSPSLCATISLVGVLLATAV